MGEKMTPQAALAAFWPAFCDADWHLIDDDACEDGADLADIWEAAGLIELRPVDDDDLDDPFAYDRGIEAGGYVWDLTPAGHQALTHPQATESADQPAESGDGHG